MEGDEERQLGRIHTIARWGVGLVWIYHGLVPKVLFRDWTEVRLLGDAGMDLQLIPSALQIVGYAEIGFGILVLASWGSRWPLVATIGIMIGGLLGVAQKSPDVLHAAFNPVSLNGMMIALAAIALIAQRRVEPGEPEKPARAE